MSDPAEVGRAHGLDDKEIEELKKEFETADTDKTGRISENQLRKLVFNRLYKERHPAKLASLSSVLQFPSEELPGDMLSVANSEGFGMDKKFSVVEAESLLSTTTAGQKEPARDTLDPSQSRSSGRRRKSLSLASSSANSSPLAGVSAANGTAQTASWGNPEKAAYSWQTQFATDTGRRRSMMAKDSVLGMLPKEYLEDAQTAKLVASNAFGEFGSNIHMTRAEDGDETGASSMCLESFIMWNALLVKSSAEASSDPSKQLKYWKGIHEADVEEEIKDGSFKLGQPIATKSVYKHLSSPPEKEGKRGWFKKLFSWFF